MSLRAPHLPLIACLLACFAGAGGGAADVPILPRRVVATLTGETLVAAREGRLQAALGAGPAAVQFSPDEPEGGRGACVFLHAGLLPERLDFRVATAAPAAVLRVVTDATGQFTVWEGDVPVLRYNAQPVPVPDGITGPYAVARADYIHPLYGLAGEVLTADYVKDHPHHRGIYWAWPEVTWNGTTHDLHALQGIEARLEGSVRSAAGPVFARLDAGYLWYWEGREPLLRETVAILAFRSAGGLRCIDLELSFAALHPGVSLARRHQDAYGGLSLRFSARAGQQLTAHAGPPRFPAAECWGELTGTPSGGSGPVGVLMLPHPDNLSYPEDWISYPELNWLQPASPAAGTAFALEPGQPLTLRYRLIVRQGDGLQAEPELLWRNYLEDWMPMASLGGYRFGLDTAPLCAWERRFSACPPEDRPALGTALAALLASPGASADLKRWAGGQLKLYGGAEAVPALVGSLGDAALAAVAADVLETLPNREVDAALRQALPGLPPERQVQVIAALSARRDVAAVPLLLPLATGSVPGVNDAAAVALAAIGTVAAVQAQMQVLAARPAAPSVADAAVACARKLCQGTAAERAAGVGLLRAIVDAKVPEPQRSAALAEWGAAEPTTSLALALGWLAEGSARERRGAALLLRRLPAGSMTAALLEHARALNSPAALVAIELLAERPDPATAPLLRERLSDPCCGAAAARLLGQVGTAGDVPALADLAAERSEVGEAARQALLALPGADVDAAIRALGGSPAVGRRRLAADLLATRLGAQSLADMRGLARDADPAVARRAFDTIGEFGGMDLTPGLVAMLPELAAEQRAMALGALGQIGRRAGDPTPVVQELCRRAQADAGLRAEILGCLHSLACDAAAEALQEALASADPAQVEAAGRALLKWPVRPAPGLPDALRQALAKAATETLRAVLGKALEHLDLLATRNLCLGRPVTSSHPWQGEWRPELAVDGVIATTSYWSCAFSPAALTVDLGEPQPLAAVRVINYWDGSRYYRYTVEGSVDGTAWVQLADQSQNTTPATEEGTLHRLTGQRVRYLRVTMLSNSANPGMHIVELQAFSQLPARE